MESRDFEWQWDWSTDGEACGLRQVEIRAKGGKLHVCVTEAVEEDEEVLGGFRGGRGRGGEGVDEGRGEIRGFGEAWGRHRSTGVGMVGEALWGRMRLEGAWQ